MVTSPATHQPVRRAALISGALLLAIAVLAGFANFGVMENVVAAGDAERTLRNLREGETAFRYGVAAFLVAAILDVVVAWTLLVFFRPVHAGVATLAAWLRAVYGGVFVVAIAQLAAVPSLLGTTGRSVLSQVNAFDDIWNAGLGLFGLHLVLLGYLSYKSGYIPRWMAALLVIAGLGYLVDSFGALLVPGYSIELAMFTFVGEPVLMVWLLVKGGKAGPRGGPVRDGRPFPSA